MNIDELNEERHMQDRENNNAQAHMESSGCVHCPKCGLPTPQDMLVMCEGEGCTCKETGCVRSNCMIQVHDGNRTHYYCSVDCLDGAAEDQGSMFVAAVTFACFVLLAALAVGCIIGRLVR
jgi:hypothetical protein